MLFRLSLALTAEIALVSTVRLLCRQALEAFSLSEQALGDVESLVGELVTNAVLHSQSPDYRVDLELHESCLIVTVTDQGVGFQRDSLPGIGTERPVIGLEKADLSCDFKESRFGGWGLPLVESLADEVEYVSRQPRGTMVRVRKNLQASQLYCPGPCPVNPDKEALPSRHTYTPASFKLTSSSG